MHHLKLTEEKALPLIHWLDELHGEDQQKISAALFFLIARRRIRAEHVPKEDFLALVEIIYDVVQRDDYSGVPWANDR